ncbi:MAG TPA: DUF3137 domain-containing protein, partial [Caulobacteraceae bacterium]|nr:DUF3137 domain-containing protein [Caulobacteraceae bacterium]
MTSTLDAEAPATGGPAFGQRLAPPGDPLEGAAFDAIYEAKIKPELVKREAERRSAMTAFLLAIVAGALLVLLEFLLTPDVSHGTETAPPALLVIATIVLAIALGYWPLANVAKKAKVGVIQALCQPLGVTYAPDGRDAPAWDDFLRLRLLPRPEDKTFQDFFHGRRGQVDFVLCEANLMQGSGKNRHTVFHGQLFCLQTPRSRTGTTVCLRNTGWFKSFECPQGLRAVGLEDPRFNQHFAVFGSDQVEAREVLTPAFMEQLNQLEGVYVGGHIRCAFDQSLLLIALEGPNRFEIGSMFTTLVDQSRVAGIARNLDQVFHLIDEF